MPPQIAIQKKGLSSLFMTHRLNVMYAPVKFHEYIPYGLGVMARIRSGTYGRTDGRTDGLGVMARIRFTIWN